VSLDPIDGTRCFHEQENNHHYLELVGPFNGIELDCEIEIICFNSKVGPMTNCFLCQIVSLI